MNGNNSKETFDKSWLDETIAGTGRSADKVIPLLQAVQRQYNYLPGEALEYICSQTDITPASICGVSTFYSQFRHRPAGRHTVNICIGTACHVKGANLIYDALHRHLGCAGDDDTDPEGVFTLQKVSCLGCCSLAPAVQIDTFTYGHVTTSSAPGILKDFLRRQKNGEENGKNNASPSHVNQTNEIRISLDSCCAAGGNDKIDEAARSIVTKFNLPVHVKKVGCVGMCYQTPLMEIVQKDRESQFYVKIDPEDVGGIILKHFEPTGFFNRIHGAAYSFAETLLTSPSPKGTQQDRMERRINHKSVESFIGVQKYIASEHSGSIGPLDIEEYAKAGGFKALQLALCKYSPAQVIDMVVDSGLRGRGGAGFPTGVKWKLVHEATGQKTYVICNGDEGDPGAFMDRMLLESYPFRIIEGMIIAAYAVGASEGIFYIRAEYPFALARIREALDICRERGYIGSNVMGGPFSIDLRVVEGAGAFVCGEETALIKSIEGKRGMPDFKPPFPAQQGLWGQPTLVNNCETLANVAWIIRNGSSRFAATGTRGSAGTKVFSLAGKIRNTALIEIPMGMTIRQIIEDIGGGIAGDGKIKAVQIGGPSGGCIPARLCDTPVDYEQLLKHGAMMGSGGLVVLDETDCMVDIAKYFLTFTQDQSCGRCTFCRVGTHRMLNILDKICTGKGTRTDLQTLEDLATNIKETSLCGLGKTAPNPVLTTLKYFREEYEAHLRGECPAGKCKDLISYTIDDTCKGCTICSQICPVEAVAYTPYQRHTIDDSACTRCDTCRAGCPEDSIKIISRKKVEAR